MQGNRAGQRGWSGPKATAAFTLMKHEGRWKIVALAFATER